jgi:hypothetical protein
MESTIVEPRCTIVVSTPEDRPANAQVRRLVRHSRGGTQLEEPHPVSGQRDRVQPLLQGHVLDQHPVPDGAAEGGDIDATRLRRPVVFELQGAVPDRVFQGGGTDLEGAGCIALAPVLERALDQL